MRLVLLCFLLFSALVSQAAAQTASGAPRDDRSYPCAVGANCTAGATYDSSGALIAGQVYAFSYGNADTSYNAFATGRERRVSCSTFAGQPAPGYVLDECRVQPVTLPDAGPFVVCPLDTYRICDISLPANQYALVRIGYMDNWIYHYVSGPFRCPSTLSETFHGMSLMALDASVMQCEVGTRALTGALNLPWTGCAASEGQTCRFPGSGTYLVRFGSELKGGFFFTRIVSGSQATCSIAAFGDPSPGNPKRCEYLAIPQVLKVAGQWEIAGLCEYCTNVTFNVTTGVTAGRARSKQDIWSGEVRVSVSRGGEASPWSGSVSAAVSGSTREMSGDSFTEESNDTLTVTCDLGVLWQWVTSVESLCLPGSGNSCVTVSRSRTFQCLRPGESPGTQPIAITGANGTPKGLTTTSDACLAQWKQMAGDQMVIPSAVAAKALNVDEYVVDPDGSFEITYRKWTFLCPTLPSR